MIILYGGACVCRNFRRVDLGSTAELAYFYAGDWDIAGAIDFSGISTASGIKKGATYRTISTDPSQTSVTITGITWKVNDYLIIKNNITSGGTITINDVLYSDKNPGYNTSVPGDLGKNTEAVTKNIVLGGL